MASANPGDDQTQLIHRSLGYRISFISGWLYWLNWIIVLAVDVVAAGTFLHYWFPTVPVWQLTSLCAVLILVLNFLSVKVFGEVEFWLSSIKVAALIGFVFLGAWLLFISGVGTEPAPGLTHYTEAGGFFPEGISGVLASLVIVIFSFGGSEMIGLTLSEAKDSHKVLPKVLRGVIVRISIFYILPILVIVGLVPWNKVASEESPFVQALSSLGLTGAASTMNFVMLVAVLSAANSAMYATSRLLYSLAKDGEAPKVFTRLSKKSVPILGLLVSAAFMFLGAFLSFVAKEKVFAYLMGIPGFTVLLMWIVITASQIKLRKTYEQKASFRVSFYPFSSWLTILALLAILIAMITTGNNIMHTIIVLIILAILGIASMVVRPPSDIKQRSIDSN
jgi:AAT family amino acid transporter